MINQYSLLKDTVHMVTHTVMPDNAPQALMDNSQSLEHFAKKLICVAFTAIYAAYFLDHLMVRSDFIELLKFMEA